MFNVGDKIVGNEKGDHIYLITRGGWKGVVQSVQGDFFTARPLEKPVPVFKDLSPKYFDLVEEAKPQILITTESYV